MKRYKMWLCKWRLLSL